MQRESAGGLLSHDAEALRTAFKLEGCPICALVRESVQHYMSNWQYEGFTDVEHRQKLIQSRGFCPLHTWQLAQQDNTAQLALIYREILSDILDDLNKDYRKLSATEPDEVGFAVVRKMWKRRAQQQREDAQPAYEACPICRIRAEAEDRLIGVLLEQLRSLETQAEMCQSTGLCLLHFSQAHRRFEKSDPSVLRALLECQRTCMLRVLEEVQEAIRKHDYRFANEPRGNEMTSWRRAAELLAGNPGVR